MAGIRLTPNVDGCPPTETPAGDYQNPFRLDDDDAFWVRQCFIGFKYFGAARHDIVVWPPPIIGSPACPVTPWSSGVENLSNGIKAGRYRNVTVTNDLDCPVGLLVSQDLVVDVTARGDNRVYVAVQARFNGVHHSWTAASTPQFTATTKHVRRQMTISANPHDQIFEGGRSDGAAAPTYESSMVVHPGESAVISAKLHVLYGDNNIPSGTETLNATNSAVRVYGYIL